MGCSDVHVAKKECGVRRVISVWSLLDVFSWLVRVPKKRLKANAHHEKRLASM